MTSLLPTLFVVVAVAMGPQQSSNNVAADDLTRVRELYALAAYEDALSRLDAAGANIDASDAAQYRALCLIGLSRVVEAEQTMERFVVDYPEHTMTEGEVSPRLVTMYRDARKRVVPATARARYSEAKGAFDRGQHVRAARAFREVVALLADDDFIGQTEGLRDLRVLTEGFLSLAEGEIEKAEHAAVPPPPAVAAAPAPAAAVAADEPAPAPPTGPGPAVSRAAAPTAAPTPVSTTADAVVYSEADSLVQPPVDLQRRLPAWNPPPALAMREFRGRLEVVIDETGSVVSAGIIDSVHATYDTSLIDAAARWRFQPATRDSVPVRYRKTFEIVLNRR